MEFTLSSTLSTRDGIRMGTFAPTTTWAHCEPPKYFCVTELTGFSHVSEQPGIHARWHRLADRFRGAHNRDLRTCQPQASHDFNGVLYDLLLLLQVRRHV